MKEQLLTRALELEPRLIAIRRDLHQHPELGFQENRTAEKVAEILESAGVEVQRGVCRTGVLGLIRGKSPGKTLLLRADMDALLVQEENDVPYRSLTNGQMHACGHDAHTTWLLGAAMLLSGQKEQLHGNVKLMFQPSEETPGGADGMIACGALKDPDVDFALGAHVSPSFDAGTYLIQEGPVTANPDFFTLKLYGNGAHGSEPQHAVDAVNLGVQVYELLQTFVSRICDPCKEVVLSVCTFHSGTSQGTIPGECELSGTVRSFQPEVQQQAKSFIDRCARSVTELYGGRYELNYRINCFPVNNDPRLTELVSRHTMELLGSDRVVEHAEKFMSGEDFCFVSRAVPSTFLFVGSRNEALFPAVPLHNPRFNLDESVLARTSAVLAYNALKLLEE